MAKKRTAGRAKRLAVKVTVPQNRDEVTAAIAEIGRLMRERLRLEAAQGDEISVIRERYEAQAQPLGERVQALTMGIETWCAANRAELTGGDKRKTVTFPTGDVRWRMTPPKVSLRGVEEVLKQLRALKLQRFIRTSEEVNKEAVLADPKAVADVTGITISQGEDFEVLPHEAPLAEVAS